MFIVLLVQCQYTTNFAQLTNTQHGTDWAVPLWIREGTRPREEEEVSYLPTLPGKSDRYWFDKIFTDWLIYEGLHLNIDNLELTAGFINFSNLSTQRERESQRLYSQCFSFSNFSIPMPHKTCWTNLSSPTIITIPSFLNHSPRHKPFMSALVRYINNRSGRSAGLGSSRTWDDSGEKETDN